MEIHKTTHPENSSSQLQFDLGIIKQAASSGRELESRDIFRLLDLTGTADEASQMPLPGGTFATGLEISREFGLVIKAGFPDAELERFSGSLRKGHARVLAATALTDAASFLERFRTTFSYQALCSVVRSDRTKRIEGHLLLLFQRLLALADSLSRHDSTIIEDLELVIRTDPDGKLLPLKGRGRLGAGKPKRNQVPVEKIERMLHPESIGIIGVSATKINFGRIILNNILASGYDKSKLILIRPGEAEIDGVKCVESLAALKHRLDLLVVAVTADAVFSLVEEVIATNAAESVMLIPGGLGETRNSREPTAKMIERIQESRRQGGDGPAFLGGNCLGIVSHPGNYDTWFIPKERLPKPQKRFPRNSALISQSGAFMVTRLSGNPWLDPAYMVAVGNQNDISHSDIVRYFNSKEDIHVIGMYIEGFNVMDGLAFASAVREAVIRGKQIVIYKAGLSLAGKDATMSHTASVAGDYELCESVLTQAGAMIARDPTEFNDLFYIATCMHGKTVKSNRLGAISGAGFETVGMADSIRAEDYSLIMAPLEEHTVKCCEEILRTKKLDALMEVRNPFDINPGADDDAHLDCTAAFVADPNVDAVAVGLDPGSPMMKTLLKSARPGYDINHEKSIVQTFPELVKRTDKPVIGIVDGGTLYDPMAENLMDKGVCIFRSCDRGIHALARYTESRIRANTMQRLQQ